MERPPIWMAITMLSGLFLVTAGSLYYSFVGPHPDASGSINENVLNPLFWTDHPGISSIMLGGILAIGTYMALSRFDRANAAKDSKRPPEAK
jgi:hypothetical protein